MPCLKMVENDTAAVGTTGKYVSELAFGMIDMQIHFGETHMRHR